MIELRDYQEELYIKARLAFKEGSKGICIVLPCRSGKSFIMAKMAQDANKKGNNVLILAHRNSLISQHKELFEELELNNSMTRIESVFTEAKHLGEKGKVDLIIIDEGHLSGASSYQKVCNYYNCSIVLFTATPARLDGKPLDLADRLITGITPKELIQRGNISDYVYYAPDLQLDFSDIRKSCGDYNNQQIGERMSSRTIYGDVLKYYNMLGKGKQAIAYCVNVKHSQEVCNMFNENGIAAKHIDAKTPEKEREQIMQEFKEGKFTILCNCNLISEGITLPSADVGLLLRPTLSLPLYIQQSCRVLTPVAGKKAIIIDYVNNIQRHGFPTANRNWSLSSKVEEYNNENNDGTFKIRVCSECFSTYESRTNSRCPYCGAEYEMTPVEILNKKEIELKKIEEEKELKRQIFLDNIKDIVSEYKKPEECRNWVELTQYAKIHNYKPGWAFVMAKKFNIFIPKK